jgi:hypothetical protein
MKREMVRQVVCFDRRSRRRRNVFVVELGPRKAVQCRPHELLIMVSMPVGCNDLLGVLG